MARFPNTSELKEPLLPIAEALTLTSPDALRAQVRVRRKLMDELVGRLYPPILADEVEKLLCRLGEIRLQETAPAAPVDERAAVVAWLRQVAADYRFDQMKDELEGEAEVVEGYADQIEKGAHLLPAKVWGGRETAPHVDVLEPSSLFQRRVHL